MDLLSIIATAFGIVGGLYGLWSFVRRRRFAMVRFERMDRTLYSFGASVLLLPIEKLPIIKGLSINQIIKNVEDNELKRLIDKVAVDYEWIDTSKNGGTAEWKFTRAGNYALITRISIDQDIYPFSIEMGKFYNFRLKDKWNLTWLVVMDPPISL